MEAMGGVLKAERERRGLSLEDVHESTRITVQNLAALEEDRFDVFPNRVYARAFLRDYANFLGLDSGALLARYEDQWNAGLEAAAPAARGSVWRTVGALVLVLVVLGGLSAVGYFGWAAYEKNARITRVARRIPTHRRQTEVATLPRPITPVKPEAAPKPKPEARPEAAPEAAPDKVRLELSTLGLVWVRVKCDGQIALIATLPKDQTRTFEAKKQIEIRVGRSNAVQIKVNGKLQPPLGPVDTPGSQVYKLPVAAGTSGQPASTDTSQPPSL